MVGNLLLRGMIAGVIAAVMATLAARLFAEPQVDLAIAFEAAHEHAAHAIAMAPEPELVSRSVQKGLGLLTAITLYGAAIGGFFSLVFAATYGRSTAMGPRTLALLLAIAGFVTVALVPAIKYPPTPPAVGQHETVALRTIAYFTMTGLSIVSLLLAARMRLLLAKRIGELNAALAAAGLFVVAISVLQFALPGINEVPRDFPAVVLWDFRIASLATQAVLWAAVGTIFGALADTVLKRKQAMPR